MSSPRIKVGERVEALKHILPPSSVYVRKALGPIAGEVAYVGPVVHREGHWVGVVFAEPIGSCDGMVDGKRYFACDLKHGVFVLPSHLKSIDSRSHEDIVPTIFPYAHNPGKWPPSVRRQHVHFRLLEEGTEADHARKNNALAGLRSYQSEQPGKVWGLAGPGCAAGGGRDLGTKQASVGSTGAHGLGSKQVSLLSLRGGERGNEFAPLGEREEDLHAQLKALRSEHSALQKTHKKTLKENTLLEEKCKRRDLAIKQLKAENRVLKSDYEKVLAAVRYIPQRAEKKAPSHS